VSLPLLNKSHLHSEKLLSLICRVNEKDALIEIRNIETFIDNLKSKYDNYNLFVSQ